MKKIILLKIIPLILLSGCSIAGSVSDLPTHNSRLFILSGQSNMARLNPDLSFTPALKKAFPNDEIIVIKDARGGQAIRRWYKKTVADPNEQADTAPGDLYYRLMNKVKADAANKHFTTVSFIWMQGETDAQKHHGDGYAVELRGVIDQVKQDTGRADLYFVIGRISDFGLKRKRVAGEWEKVRNAQVQIAESDSHGAWVDTDDLNGDQDDLHYTEEGYKKFGARLAQAAITQLTTR